MEQTDMDTGLSWDENTERKVSSFETVDFSVEIKLSLLSVQSSWMKSDIRDDSLAAG